MVDTNMTKLEQEISVPLTVGDKVSLLEDIDIEEGGHAGTLIFEDTVAQYVPDTGLLRFEDSDIGRAEFLSMVEEAEGIEIVQP